MRIFKPITEFPRYTIDDEGWVYSLDLKRLLSRNINQQGIVSVCLVKEGKQYRRSVAILVADIYLEGRPDNKSVAIIHIDGDRTNVRAKNLAWRTRPYAIAYHRQFIGRTKPMINKRLRIEETGEVFRNSIELGLAYGILEREIALSVKNNERGWSYDVYPYGYHIHYAT